MSCKLHPQSWSSCVYMQFYHDHPLSKHLGFHRVLEKLCSLFYWPDFHSSPPLSRQLELQNSSSTHRHSILYLHPTPIWIGGLVVGNCRHRNTAVNLIVTMIKTMEEILATRINGYYAKLHVLSKSLGISQLFASPYHPQTNRLIKQMNKTIKLIIVAFVDPQREVWVRSYPL